MERNDRSSCRKKGQSRETIVVFLVLLPAASFSSGYIPPANPV